MRDAPLAFFVQNNYIERLTAPVAIFARERAIALEDRSNYEGFDPDSCGIDWSAYRGVLPYGSVQFIRKIQSSSLNHFVLYEEDRFAASTWAPIFGSLALGGRGRVVPVAGVEAFLRVNGPSHLRPDRVDKAFVGGVFDCAAWTAMKTQAKLESSLACWVSPITVIEAEWRCWVIGGRVQDVSQYRRGGVAHLRHEEAAEVIEAAQRLANLYTPAPCVVMDIAWANGQFSVVEFNPIHCSGWYAADIPKILSGWLDWARDGDWIAGKVLQEVKNADVCSSV